MKINPNPDFEQILSGIRESTESIDTNCPKCKFDKNRYYMQSLNFDEKSGAMVDIYCYKCFSCGQNYSVTSRPLKHMQHVSEFCKNVKKS